MEIYIGNHIICTRIYYSGINLASSELEQNCDTILWLERCPEFWYVKWFCGLCTWCKHTKTKKKTFLHIYMHKYILIYIFIHMYVISFFFLNIRWLMKEHVDDALQKMSPIYLKVFRRVWEISPFGLCTSLGLMAYYELHSKNVFLFFFFFFFMIPRKWIKQNFYWSIIFNEL